MTHPDSPLLVCEGPCRRPFHYPCAGLATLPPDHETWICQDCLGNRHKCTVCKTYGKVGEEVFKCEKDKCGLFYHEACLAMYESVEISYTTEVISTRTLDYDRKPSPQSDTKDIVRDGKGNDETTLTNEVHSETIKIPKFVCPAHSCWTCSGGVPPEHGSKNIGDDDKSKKKGRGKKRKKCQWSKVFGEKPGRLFVSLFVFSTSLDD